MCYFSERILMRHSLGMRGEGVVKKMGKLKTMAEGCISVC